MRISALDTEDLQCVRTSPSASLPTQRLRKDDTQFSNAEPLKETASTVYEEHTETILKETGAESGLATPETLDVPPSPPDTSSSQSIRTSPLADLPTQLTCEDHTQVSKTEALNEPASAINESHTETTLKEIGSESGLTTPETLDVPPSPPDTSSSQCIRSNPLAGLPTQPPLNDHIKYKMLRAQKKCSRVVRKSHTKTTLKKIEPESGRAPPETIATPPSVPDTSGSQCIRSSPLADLPTQLPCKDHTQFNMAEALEALKQSFSAVHKSHPETTLKKIEPESGRAPPETLAMPSSAPDTSGSRCIKTSPSADLPTQLILMARTQFSRVKTLQNIASAIFKSYTDTTIHQVNLFQTQVRGIHMAFKQDHAYFQTVWPATHIDHEYFTRNTYEEEARLVIEIQHTLLRLKQALKDPLNVAKLTPNALPRFFGQYDAWPSFKERFVSLIGNANLTELQKLQYLRECMGGIPAQLIQGLPFTENSLQASWELLVARYENKRLIVQAHLDQLFNVPTPVAKGAAGLMKLISTASEVYKALQSVEVSQNTWDCIMVYHVSKHLDRETLAAWETYLGTSVNYPCFRELEAFVKDRAQLLERIEAASAQFSTAQI